MTQECWWVANISGQVAFEKTTTLNTVISAEVTTTSNPMYDWNSPNVSQVGMYLCADPALSGGLFRLGVWDSSGDIKVVSNQFTVADLVEGTDENDVEEFLIPLTETTSIAVGDNVGMIMNEACPETGQIIGGGFVSPPSLGGNWRRHIFVQGSATTGFSDSKMIAVCLSTDVAPTAAKIFSPPLYKSNVNIIPREIK